MDSSELDALFDRPLAEFVSARNDLSKALKADGRKDDAKVVKALKRPSLPAWAINQLVRRHRDHVDRLLDALDDVRLAQIGQDEDDRKPLAEAMANERAALAKLEDTAIEVLESGGHPASRGTLDRVMRSVRAAAADVGKRDELLRAQLIAEIEDEGFGSLMAQLGGGAVPPPAAAPPKPQPESEPPAEPPREEPPTAPPVDLAAERKRREEEERLAKERERREKIAAAKRLAEARRMELEKLEKDLAIAERELAEAKRRLTAAEENHDGARRRTDLARARRAEADEALKAAEAGES